MRDPGAPLDLYRLLEPAGEPELLSRIEDLGLGRTFDADSKKDRVARVQVYLVGIADNLGEYLQSPEHIDWLITRGEIMEGEKSLSSTAKHAGVTVYTFFQNAGYRGMYNVNLEQLRQIKGVPAKRSPLDFMNNTELAANLFRITQTDGP
ncbi:MAG TPA: hypothetical protein VFC31_01445 [Candidatus Limnocylindria bacterium]|nr:hypothetical protein [Candidatus Limnocylindria bacterium]